MRLHFRKLPNSHPYVAAGAHNLTCRVAPLQKERLTPGTFTEEKLRVAQSASKLRRTDNLRPAAPTRLPARDPLQSLESRPSRRHSITILGARRNADEGLPEDIPLREVVKELVGGVTREVGSKRLGDVDGHAGKRKVVLRVLRQQIRRLHEVEVMREEVEHLHDVQDTTGTIQVLGYMLPRAAERCHVGVCATVDQHPI